MFKFLKSICIKKPPESILDNFYKNKIGMCKKKYESDNSFRKRIAKKLLEVINNV